jgi:plasmid stability protein
MAQLTIRKVDDVVVKRLRQRAKRSQRSLEAELRVILADAVPAAAPERAAAWDEIDRIRERARRRLKGRAPEDSTKAIRAARDGRARH